MSDMLTIRFTFVFSLAVQITFVKQYKHTTEQSIFFTSDKFSSFVIKITAKSSQYPVQYIILNINLVNVLACQIKYDLLLIL